MTEEWIHTKQSNNPALLRAYGNGKPHAILGLSLTSLKSGEVIDENIFRRLGTFHAKFPSDSIRNLYMRNHRSRVWIMMVTFCHWVIRHQDCIYGHGEGCFLLLLFCFVFLGGAGDGGWGWGGGGN